MTASRTVRTLAGGPVVHYGPRPLNLRGRLALEWQALRTLADRLHDMPGQITDATGTVLYAVVVEADRWVVRPSHGWRSYRWLAAPIAANSALRRGDEAGAVAWARTVVERLRPGAA